MKRILSLLCVSILMILSMTTAYSEGGSLNSQVGIEKVRTLISNHNNLIKNSGYPEYSLIEDTGAAENTGLIYKEAHGLVDCQFSLTEDGNNIGSVSVSAYGENGAILLMLTGAVVYSELGGKNFEDFSLWFVGDMLEISKKNKNMSSYKEEKMRVGMIRFDIPNEDTMYNIGFNVDD